MRYQIRLFITGVALMLLVTGTGSTEVFADKGMMSIGVHIPLEEPGQKAIICWDGQEELMILSTDVRAESPTKVLEIFPLPSEPEIKTANETIFENLKQLVEERSYKEEKGGFSMGLADSGVEVNIDVDIIFHDILGVHNITVIKARTAEGFALYVNDFMENIGLDPIDLSDAESIANSYMLREINYFVLDILELGTEVKSPQPLMYRFNSTSVYYPLEITSLTGGNTRILLFVLTPHEVVKKTYTEKERNFFGITTKTLRDDKYIKIKKPDSPVNFELLTDAVVSTSTLKQYAQRRYSRDEDYDLLEVSEFFDSGDVKICVYEYDGPVEMEGDISVSEYSVQTVRLDEEYDLNSANIFLVIFVPPVIVTIILFVLILWLVKKQSKTPPGS